MCNHFYLVTFWKTIPKDGKRSWFAAALIQGKKKHYAEDNGSWKHKPAPEKQSAHEHSEVWLNRNSDASPAHFCIRDSNIARVKSPKEIAEVF